MSTTVAPQPVPAGDAPAAATAAAPPRPTAAAALDRSPANNAEPGLGRLVVIGSVIGTIGAWLLVGGGLLLAGKGWPAALGVGGFAAFWGGLGFGSMLGGVAYAIDQH